MPNIKSAKKRVQLSSVYASRNQSAKSALKTSVKKFDSAADSGSASEEFNAAVAMVDKSVKKGILHKNTAARKKSRMAKKLNSIAQ